MKKVLWAEMRRLEFDEALKKDAVVIVPVGSTEQHGTHLPINTDANCCFSIAKKAAESVKDFPVLVLPPVWTGYSPHHMSFQGAVTLSFQTFVEVLTEIAGSIHDHGFKKILFLNGHGGNSPAVSVLRNKLLDEGGFPVVGMDYFTLPGVVSFLKQICETDKGAIGHSGEVETSLQLFLQPELVDKKSIKWVQGMRGNPDKASREKGEKIFSFIVKALVQVLSDFHSGKLEERFLWRKEILE